MNDHARILVIDDTPAARYAKVRLLTRAGYEVVEASTGLDGVRAAIESRPELVLLDVKLPDIDGFEVCRLLRENEVTAAVAVVLISASYIASDHRVQGLEGGADHYLAGTIEPDLMVATVRATLRMRRAEQAALANEARFRTLAEEMPPYVWETDETGHTTFESARWKAFLGREASGTLLDDLERLQHPDDGGAVSSAWRASLVEGREFDVEARLARPDGVYRWMRFTAAPVRDTAGAVRRWVGTALDIHERREATDALEAMRLNLEQRVKDAIAGLEERTDQVLSFSYTVSHDLRAPLRALRGYADTLLDDFAPQLGPVGAGYCRRIAEAATRMDRLTHDLLAYGRLLHADLGHAPVRLAEALQTALAEVEPLFRENGVRYQQLLPADLPEVSAHRSTLEHVLINLLQNAAKFSDPSREPEITVDARVEDGALRVTVRDNGIGIAPEHQSRIFEVFERLQTQTRYEGTGIGLAMVRRSMERMGGRFGVDSEPGVGSRFWIELPIAAPVPAAAAAGR